MGFKQGRGPWVLHYILNEIEKFWTHLEAAFPHDFRDGKNLANSLVKSEVDKNDLYVGPLM